MSEKRSERKWHESLLGSEQKWHESLREYVRVVDSAAAELASDTHKGFSIKCDRCGEGYVVVQSDVGFSPQSGGWGSVRLRCLACDADVDLWKPS